MKLSSAVKCVVSGLSLTSAVAIENSLRGGNRDSRVSPFDVMVCTSQALNDESKCTSAQNADGSDCSYCTMVHNGEKVGVCVDPKVASRMVQINDEVTCTKLQENALEMDPEEKKIPRRFIPAINMAKCLFKGGQIEDQCFSVDLPEKKHCAFCKVESNGQEGVLCVGPEAVPQMTASGQNISCSLPDDILYDDMLYVEEPELDDDREEVTYDTLKNFFDKVLHNNPLSFEMQTKISLDIPFFDSFKCAMNGGQNEDTCSSVELDGDRKCGFCKYENNGQEAVICVSPEAANKLSESSEDITCTGWHNNPTEIVEPKDDEEVIRYNAMSAGMKSVDAVSSMPAADCNLKGTNREKCLDPSKVNGAECVWCDGGVGGFCFPKSWENTASKLFKCGQNLNLMRDEAELKID